MADYRKMWQDLGMDLEKHDEFLAAVPDIYGELFVSQQKRPAGMEYFDFVMSEVHGLRVKELLDKKAEGKKVVSSFCVFVPEEFVLAAGGACIGLCAGAQYSVPIGEKVLPRSLCPLIKSSLGFKLGGLCPYFEVSDFVVGETTCDGKKKAWEILAQYHPTYVMELPQKKGEADKELWLKEVYKFKEKVEAETGVTITPESLSEAIKLANRRRKVLQRLYDTRKHDPVPISGKDAMLITQLSFFDDPERFIEKTSALCDELEDRVAKGEGAAPKGAPRILITGTPMPLPSWKMHHIIESSGAVVVCEESCTGTRSFETLVDETKTGLNEQVEAISRRALNINCACYTPNTGRIDDILRQVKEYKADGVVYYSLQFCQSYSVEYHLVEKALQEAGIPVMRIESDYSDEDAGQLQTRIEAFLEMIK
ncbi:benzoyl-CoA reductase/2-hydroxyglutaryl-CoA dehydratase subunit BcrC/BadD/HgdB [Desulfohalotomaculum tongense]|uniref:double-cubane-cluster-containing anaerobic reductase n=1 Tax=Desulforadius tongensis TaxID=1216062 RepID=UPI001EE55572|nr:double-cubane-cluster-containing anaerobic reductase [Desulforadius tongensis]MBM7854665.1 benzoyl-CoA reductase/2-hydroxyglutaryl-CoA dehydratase subunit BcrC/BadD/HgdB [Desulforadius tongensis]